MLHDFLQWLPPETQVACVNLVSDHLLDAEHASFCQQASASQIQMSDVRSL